MILPAARALSWHLFSSLRPSGGGAAPAPPTLVGGGLGLLLGVWSAASPDCSDHYRGGQQEIAHQEGGEIPRHNATRGKSYQKEHA